MPYVVVGQYAVLWAFGIPRFSWRYIGLREVSWIFAAIASSTVFLVVIRLALGSLQHELAYLRHGVLPLGAIALDGAFAFLAISGVRVFRRLIGERADTRSRRSGDAAEPVPTMLVGAGQAGLMVTKELAARPDLMFRAVGFVDDDPSKVGTILNGVPVLGVTDQLVELCTRRGARQVLITMASAPGSTVRRVQQLAEKAGIPVMIVPGLYEIVGGRVNVTRIRPVAIEDLLGREPVALEDDRIAEGIEGKCVLVTGAGGSIGSELCRQIVSFRPAELLLVERAENNLFEIHRELSRTAPDIVLTPLIADVTDLQRMTAIFEEHRPRAVFHAAAHKHVPMMEWNPAEAVKNNVGGTRNVVDLAVKYEAESFVMISTDKAVNPTSVMGATKRVAELYVQALAAHTSTRLVTVRFGNVLGSSGSVIPIFRDQIARGGPVTVTDPEMRRYFMTIPEACQLVMQAGSMGEGGEIFVLDMGEPVKIVDLAKDLIALSGFSPDAIEIKFTGLRPGEKLFEEISLGSEHASKTRHPKIFVGNAQPLEIATAREQLGTLERAATMADRNRVITTLRACVREYQPGGDARRPETALSIARPLRESLESVVAK
ncbi:MAG: polysaccharide biosynthesis protein [Myxococcota bacterium]|nr:polysaccharide biosynthesis protein [Myxococcota bacterium]